MSASEPRFSTGSSSGASEARAWSMTSCCKEALLARLDKAAATMNWTNLELYTG